MMLRVSILPSHSIDDSSDARAPSLPLFSAAERKAVDKFFAKFRLAVDYVTQRWDASMVEFGYPSDVPNRYSMAREVSFNFIEVIKGHIAAEPPPTIEELKSNADDWATFFLRFWENYQDSGVSPLDTFTELSALNRAIGHGVRHLETILGKIDGSTVDKIIELMVIYWEIIDGAWLESCLLSQKNRFMSEFLTIKRQLGMEKKHFDNIFRTISDAALLMGSNCRVISANPAAFRLAGIDYRDMHIWDVLGIEMSGPEEFFEEFPVGRELEVELDKGIIYQMHITVLGEVDMLAGTEYLVMIANDTPQTALRAALEKEIEKNTVVEKKLQKRDSAMRILIKSVEAERAQKLHDLSDSIRSMAVPILKELCLESDPKTREAMSEIFLNQLELLLPVASGKKDFDDEEERDIATGIGRLTLMEMKVAHFIQAGRSSKEIASMLRISSETVQTHRRSIRRKLGITGHQVQLSAALRRHAF